MRQDTSKDSNGSRERIAQLLGMPAGSILESILKISFHTDASMKIQFRGNLQTHQ